MSLSLLLVIYCCLVRKTWDICTFYLPSKSDRLLKKTLMFTSWFFLLLFVWMNAARGRERWENDTLVQLYMTSVSHVTWSYFSSSIPIFLSLSRWLERERFSHKIIHLSNPCRNMRTSYEMNVFSDWGNQNSWYQCGTKKWFGGHFYPNQVKIWISRWCVIRDTF